MAISCDDAKSSDDVSNRTATLVVEAGEPVTCTYTNISLKDITA